MNWLSFEFASRALAFEGGECVVQARSLIMANVQTDVGLEAAEATQSYRARLTVLRIHKQRFI